MTLLANRPTTTNGSLAAESSAPQGGTYVTTRSRPGTVGSYVTTGFHGNVRAGAIRGRYVSLKHAPANQTEGRYTDRG